MLSSCSAGLQPLAGWAGWMLRGAPSCLASPVVLPQPIQPSQIWAAEQALVHFRWLQGEIASYLLLYLLYSKL